MNAKTKASAKRPREDLQGSLDPIDPEIDRLWAEEARNRLVAYLRGELKARPFEEILKKYQGP
jgi:putative addiction module component